MIASQLDSRFNTLLCEYLPGVEVVPLPRGVPLDLPREVNVLLAAPHADLRDASGPPRVGRSALISCNWSAPAWTIFRTGC